MKPLKEQSYYEVLEVDPSASMEEIRASYERLNRLLVDDNVALYPMADTSQLAGHRAAILEAMEFLTDADLRLEYDRSLGLPPGSWARPASPPPREDAARIEAVHSTHPKLSVSWVPHEPTPLQAPLAPSTVVNAGGATRAPAANSSDSPSTTRPPPVVTAPAPEPAPAPTGSVPDAEPPAPVLTEPAPVAPAPDPAPPAPMSTEPAAPPAQIAPAPVAAHPSVAVTEPAVPPAPNPAPAAAAFARSLEQAQHIAQESAIATAESALAQVSMQVAARATREVRPRPLDIPADAEFNGELLRQVRKSRGLSLPQVADRTRITRRHLENVEADRYDALPPTVYLRGILMSLARELGLDSLRVAKSYLGLVEKQRGGAK